MESRLYKRAMNLSYFTILYNIAEGMLSIFAGFMAGSTSLLGFGLDSIVESFSAIVLVWRFRKGKEMNDYEVENLEKSTLRYIGFAFLILGLYVLYESAGKIYSGEIPNPSLLGILIAIASIIVMPILYYVKLNTGNL